MIRGESHDPVYTQTPNGLSGALAAEAKDMDTLESHPGHLLLQGTATTAWQGKQDLPFPATLSQIPKWFHEKEAVWKSFLLSQAFWGRSNQRFASARGAESHIFYLFGLSCVFLWVA